MAPKHSHRGKLARITKSNMRCTSETGREWTSFEMTAIMGMLCRDEHNSLDPMAFTTKLNQALDRSGQDTISDFDVEQLLSRLQDEKKAALAFLDRQAKPEILTRAKRMVLQRSIPFTGTKTEWVLDGRREKVQAMKEKMAGKAAMSVPQPAPGKELTFANTHGVQIERWEPRQTYPLKPVLDITNTWNSEYTLSSSTNGHRENQNAAIHLAGPYCAGASALPCPSRPWPDLSSSTRFRDSLSEEAGSQPGVGTMDLNHAPWRSRDVPRTSQALPQHHQQLREHYPRYTNSWSQADVPRAPSMASGNPGVVNHPVWTTSAPPR